MRKLSFGSFGAWYKAEVRNAVTRPRPRSSFLFSSFLIAVFSVVFAVGWYISKFLH